MWPGPALVCKPRRAATDGVLTIVIQTKGSVGDQGGVIIRLKGKK